MPHNIAVIGSGMAGLATAYVFRKAGHQVTVFETLNTRGMDAHTIEVPTTGGHGYVDAPLRVMSVTGWRSVLALCEQAGVGTFAVDTPISLSWLDQTTWLRTGTWHVKGYSIPTLGGWRYLRFDTLRIIRDLARLRRDLSALPEEPLAELNPSASLATAQPAPQSRPARPETIEEFFTRRPYAPVFWRGFLLPLLGTITTCRMEHLLRYPARDLLRIVRDIVFGRPMRRIQGGTRELVRRLAHDLTFISGAAVTEVQEIPSSQGASGVRITNARGDNFVFDHVIIATQANALQFLKETCTAERQLLASITFDKGELITHTDASVMPRRREDWAPLNYLMDAKLNENMFTVWVNRVEPSLAGEEPVFQTWNPIVPLDENRVISRISLQRAVQSTATRQTLATLQAMHQDPKRRIFFCGSWAAPGVPLLESAVRSAIHVAGRLGVDVPWDPLSHSTAS